jgi:hypothetical protein
MNNLGLDAYADNLYCKTIKITNQNPSTDLVCRDLTASRNISAGGTLSAIGTTSLNQTNINTNLNIVNADNSYYTWKNGSIGASIDLLQLNHSNGKYMFNCNPNGDFYFGDAGYGTLTCFGQITSPEGFYGPQYAPSAIYGTLASPITFSTTSASNPYYYNGAPTNSVMLSPQGRATIYGVIGGTVLQNLLFVKYVYNTNTTKYNVNNTIPQVRFSFIGSAAAYNINQIGGNWLNSAGSTSIDSEWGFCLPTGAAANLPVGTKFVIDLEAKIIGA